MQVTRSTEQSHGILQQVHQNAPATCLFCGEPEHLEVLEVFSSHEFLLDTCCVGMHEVATEFLNDDAREAARLLQGRGLEILPFAAARRVVDHDGQLLLDWNLEVVPVSQRTAKEFVRAHHRHCPKPPAGWRFGAGVTNGPTLLGVIMVGRPVARMLDPATTVEVNRLCIRQDVPSPLRWNACSLLYGWASRQARWRGFRKILTYTLKSEEGTSLRAAGWVPEKVTEGGSWNTKSRPRKDHAPLEPKVRWTAAWCLERTRPNLLATRVAPSRAITSRKDEHMKKHLRGEAFASRIGGGSGDMSRDVGPVSLATNGGGSGCIEVDGFALHGGGSGG